MPAREFADFRKYGLAGNRKCVVPDIRRSVGWGLLGGTELRKAV